MQGAVGLLGPLERRTLSVLWLKSDRFERRYAAKLDRCASTAGASDSAAMEEAPAFVGSVLPAWLRDAVPAYTDAAAWGVGWLDDDAYTRQAALDRQMKRKLGKTNETGYVRPHLEAAERENFRGAVLALFHQDRVLMLVERRRDRARHAIKLRFVGGKRSHADLDAWQCALREFREETGGVLDVDATEPSMVAWNPLTRQALFVAHTADASAAAKVQGLGRPPESGPNLLPPEGPLTAVWVPIQLLLDAAFVRENVHKNAPHDHDGGFTAQVLDLYVASMRHTTTKSAANASSGARPCVRCP